jgi:hypothetical protein
VADAAELVKAAHAEALERIEAGVVGREIAW